MSLCVPRWSPVATKHLNTLLVVVLSTYLYRDLFPLATFGKRPQDLHEGWRLWTKLAVLCTIGIFMPLLAPRSYVPFDIKVRDYNLLECASNIRVGGYAHSEP